MDPATVTFEVASQIGGSGKAPAFILRSQSAHPEIHIAADQIMVIFKVEGTARSPFAKIISDNSLRLQCCDGVQGVELQKVGTGSFTILKSFGPGKLIAENDTVKFAGHEFKIEAVVGAGTPAASQTSQNTKSPAEMFKLDTDSDTDNEGGGGFAKPAPATKSPALTLTANSDLTLTASPRPNTTDGETEDKGELQRASSHLSESTVVAEGGDGEVDGEEKEQGEDEDADLTQLLGDVEDTQLNTEDPDQTQAYPMPDDMNETVEDACMETLAEDEESEEDEDAKMPEIDPDETQAMDGPDLSVPTYDESTQKLPSPKFDREADLAAEKEKEEEEEEAAKAKTKQEEEEKEKAEKQALTERLESEKLAAEKVKREAEEAAAAAEQERLRLEEEAELEEELRLEEEAELEEELRLEEEAKLAEKLRMEEQAKLAEKLRLEEQARVAAEAAAQIEKERIEEEARVAGEAAAKLEKERIEEEERVAGEAAAEQEKLRLEEEKALAEKQALASRLDELAAEKVQKDIEEKVEADSLKREMEEKAAAEKIAAENPPSPPPTTTTSSSRKRGRSTTESTTEKADSQNSEKRSKRSSVSPTPSICVLITGVEIESVAKMISKIPNATLITKLQNAHMATHVLAVSEKLPLKRTPKLLAGLSSLSTQHILGTEWLDQSAAAGQALDESEFSITQRRYKIANDAFKEKFGIAFSVIAAGQKTKADAGSRIFDDVAVFFEKGVAGDKFPPASELKFIVSSGGGKFLSKLTGKASHLLVVTEGKVSKLMKQKYSAVSDDIQILDKSGFLAAITEQKFELFDRSGEEEEESEEEEEEGEEQKKNSAKSKTKSSPKKKAAEIWSKKKSTPKVAPAKKAPAKKVKKSAKAQAPPAAPAGRSSRSASAPRKSTRRK